MHVDPLWSRNYQVLTSAVEIAYLSVLRQYGRLTLRSKVYSLQWLDAPFTTAIASSVTAFRLGSAAQPIAVRA